MDKLAMLIVSTVRVSNAVLGEEVPYGSAFTDRLDESSEDSHVLLENYTSKKTSR